MLALQAVVETVLRTGGLMSLKLKPFQHIQLFQSSSTFSLSSFVLSPVTDPSSTFGLFRDDNHPLVFCP
jgi:hypothetical protein